MGRNREIPRLRGANSEVFPDNNPLTYVFSTAKLDATGQRLVAESSNYNCTISYRSGKQNVDADGLSRVRKPGSTRTIFPDVLNLPFCNSGHCAAAIRRHPH